VVGSYRKGAGRRQALADVFVRGEPAKGLESPAEIMRIQEGAEVFSELPVAHPARRVFLAEDHIPVGAAERPSFCDATLRGPGHLWADLGACRHSSSKIATSPTPTMVNLARVGWSGARPYQGGRLDQRSATPTRPVGPAKTGAFNGACGAALATPLSDRIDGAVPRNWHLWGNGRRAPPHERDSRSPPVARQDRLCSAMRGSAPPVSAPSLRTNTGSVLEAKQGSQLKAI
jgi:hypothetical protein